MGSRCPPRSRGAPQPTDDQARASSAAAGRGATFIWQEVGVLETYAGTLHRYQRHARVLRAVRVLGIRLLPHRHDVQRLLQLVVGLAHLHVAIEALDREPSIAAATLTGSVDLALAMAEVSVA